MLQGIPKKSTSMVSQAVRKYGRGLLQYIRKRVKVLEDAEDILQDIWYQFSKLNSPDEIESISGWLYYAAKNRITDQYRKKQPDYLEDYAITDEEGELQIKDILLLDDTGNPELTLFKNLFWQELYSALDELPENQKLVFIQNELEDKTLQEIADEQGENLKTIISRKGYAVKYLRKKLEQLYTDFNS